MLLATSNQLWWLVPQQSMPTATEPLLPVLLAAAQNQPSQQVIHQELLLLLLALQTAALQHCFSEWLTLKRVR